MEYVLPKIEIYRTRTFSEKLSDTFAFLRENWRPLLKYFFYLMLPASIVLAFFMNHFMEIYMNFTMSINKGGTFGNYDIVSLLLFLFGLIVVSGLSYILLGALVFSMVRLYRRRENRLKDLTTEEVKPELLFCLKRAAVLTLAFFGILVVYILLGGGIVAMGMIINKVIGLLLLLPIYIVTIVLALSISLVEPVYMLEDDINVWGALGKGLRLGYKTFGGILAVTFIIGLLASVIQTVTSMPWSILYVVKTVFLTAFEDNSAFVNSFLYTVLQYISCVLECLGMLLSSVITTIGLVIQYGHASDKIDGVGVEENPFRRAGQVLGSSQFSVLSSQFIVHSE